MAELLQDLIRGCFLGIAIGDALGMPVETMTREQILRATGGKGVKNYLTPSQKRIKGTRKLPPGSTTDDTQLTLAVAKSLVNKREFDLRDLASVHVEELKASGYGWGRTTTTSISEIAEWFRRGGDPTNDGQPTPGTRSPEDPAPDPQTGQGCGNGVAMKIAPLAIWHFSRLGPAYLEPFITQTMNLGLMTHGDPRASFAAVAVGAALSGCLDANPNETRLYANEFRLALVRLIDLYVRAVEGRYLYFRPNTDTLKNRLQKAWSLLDRPDELRSQVGTTCFALESIPFSLAIFLRNPDDFEQAVLEAVNAGGDTDTNASIVGGLCGALLGESGIPDRLLAGLRNRDLVTVYADVFFDALTEDPENQTDLSILLP